MNSLQRKGEDTKDNGILLWTKKAKMGLWNFDLIFEPLSWWKIAYTTNQENQLKSPSIQVSKDAHDEDKKFSPKISCPALELINIQDGNIGLQLQASRGGTNPNGVGSELTNFFVRISLFWYSWFRLQLIAIHCNRRGVRVFSRAFVHSSFAHIHLHGPRCCDTCLCKKSAHPHVITCLIVRCLSTHWSLLLFRVSLHLVQFLHLLFSAHPPCGRNHRVINPLSTRRMRRMALWRYKTLSQILPLHVQYPWCIGRSASTSTVCTMCCARLVIFLHVVETAEY